MGILDNLIHLGSDLKTQIPTLICFDKGLSASELAALPAEVLRKKQGGGRTNVSLKHISISGRTATK